MSKPFDYANATIGDFIEREQYDQRLVSEVLLARLKAAAARLRREDSDG